MALSVVFHKAVIPLLVNLFFLSEKQHVQAQYLCTNLSIVTDNSKICEFTMFDVPRPMLSIQSAKRAALSRKCIQLALHCHQPVNTSEFVACTDLFKTFNASLQARFLNHTHVPLSADNPVNETLLTVCYDSYLKAACLVRICRSNDNALLLFADVHFRDRTWQRPDTGCDCSRFKRLFVERETARCRSAEEVERTPVVLDWLAVFWTGFLVVILCVNLVGLCKCVQSNMEINENCSF